MTRRDVDLDDDGTIDRTVHLNAEGRWERVERDVDDDGTIDRTVHRNTDGSNTLNRTDFDDDGDGTTDRSEFYTQNADVTGTWTMTAMTRTGTIHRSETYTYDAVDRVSEWNLDDDDDGFNRPDEFYTDMTDTTGCHQPDRVSTTMVTAQPTGASSTHQNADGNRVSRANFDDDADGTIDRSETYTYDDERQGEPDQFRR